MKTPRCLVPHGTYMADPAAHVFDGRLYIYPSHDIESGIPENDSGDQLDMRDYHVLSMDAIDGDVRDHGVALAVGDIAWAGRQLWDDQQPAGRPVRAAREPDPRRLLDRAVRLRGRRREALHDLPRPVGGPVASQ